MKQKYVFDLSVGESLQGETFAIREVRRATDKNNKQFIDLTLGDKTGSVTAKIWSRVLEEKGSTKFIKPGRLLAINAKVEDFKGNLQLNISDFYQVDEREMEEYMQSSQFNSQEMFAELEEIISKIKNDDLKALFDSLFSDSEIVDRLKYWPAAKTYHHNFRSGLLQHILECLSLLPGFERFYPQADFDVVRAGVVLHDLGKLYEIETNGIASQFTTAGSVLGHIQLGIELLEKHFPQDGSEKLKMHLKHILLSHHGVGNHTPVAPATLEAVIVHNVDETSASTRDAADALGVEPNEYGIAPFNPYMQRWMWVDNSVREAEEEIIYPED